MNQRNNMEFNLFLRCLKDCADKMDETSFIFLDDESRGECILGYLPVATIFDALGIKHKRHCDEPYWIGTGCDFERGASFLTAEEMLDAKAYGGRSIKSAWNHVYVISLGGMPLDMWFSVCCPFRQDVVDEDDYWRIR